MSETMGKLPKPKMKGLLMDQIKRNVVTAIVLSIIGGCAWRFGYMDRKKRIYANFYKNYDIEKDFNAIRNKGLFDSCDAGDDEDEEDK